MNRSGTFAITIAALSVLEMAFTAVAAPYTPKSSQCYGACTRGALLNILASDTNGSSRLLHTLQSVQSCLSD